MAPIPSVRDEPILTDDDFAILNEPVDATTTIDKDTEGEIDVEADQSVVLVEDGKEKEVTKWKFQWRNLKGGV